MRRRIQSVIAIALLLTTTAEARAFCGFFVARAETRLVNHASRVVIVRAGDHTEVTMANDYDGTPSEFAMVIPVPTVIQESQVTPVDTSVINHMDEYTAPRLATLDDPDPCWELHVRGGSADVLTLTASSVSAASMRDVKVEAHYSVGIYDIQVLSSPKSSSLQKWLRAEGYLIPDGAEPILKSYIKQGMKFFVARINLAELARRGATRLQPLRVTYDSKKFMLPIRLGTVNSAGSQELLVFMITPRGRVETTNYRTIRMPTDLDLPQSSQQMFTAVYRAAFERELAREDSEAVVLEYAWPMGQCDPCSAPRIDREEMAKLGVFWWDPGMPGYRDRNLRGSPEAVEDIHFEPYRAFVTRLHLVYTAGHFPEDLVFQETGDDKTYQCKYNLHRPWGGATRCAAADRYHREMPWRLKREAENLARFTGWEVGETRARESGAPVPGRQNSRQR